MVRVFVCVFECLRVMSKMWLCVLFVIYCAMLHGLSLCAVRVFACVVVAFALFYVCVCLCFFV